METPAKSKWDWKVFVKNVLAIIGAISIILGTIKLCMELKEVFWANPQIVNAKNCRCDVFETGEQINFELLINNPGSKNCSIMEVNLIWPNELAADSDIQIITPQFPETIPTGSSEIIRMTGYGHNNRKVSAEATVLVKFNTGYIAKKKITLMIERFGISPPVR